MAVMDRKAAIDATVIALRALTGDTARHVFKGEPLTLNGRGRVSIVTGYGSEAPNPAREMAAKASLISVIDAIKPGPATPPDPDDPDGTEAAEDILADQVEATQAVLKALGLTEIASSPAEEIDTDGTIYRAERTIARVPFFNRRTV